jgi:ABC-type transport system involved in multi-copper enzyme maturation permease subunit
MSKLFKAQLWRYLRNPVYLIAVAVSLVEGIVMGNSSYFGFTFEGVTHWSFNVDDINFLVAMLAIIAVLSLIIGQEYSEGTVRNKIICGHTKAEIYLSEFFAVFAVITPLYALMMIAFAIFGRKLFSIFSGEDILLVFVGMYLVFIAIAAVCVMICCLVKNRAVSAIVCIAVLLVLYMGGFKVGKMISEPQYEEIYEFSEETNEETVRTEYNTRYIKSDVLRTALTAVYRVNPCGQMCEYVSYMYRDDTETDDVWLEQRKVIANQPLYSLGIIAVITAVGTAVYRKRDIK